jgi:hypothetical protein
MRDANLDTDLGRIKYVHSVSHSLVPQETGPVHHSLVLQAPADDGLSAAATSQICVICVICGSIPALIRVDLRFRFLIFVSLCGETS